MYTKLKTAKRLSQLDPFQLLLGNSRYKNMLANANENNTIQRKFCGTSFEDKSLRIGCSEHKNYREINVTVFEVCAHVSSHTPIFHEHKLRG